MRRQDVNVGGRGGTDRAGSGEVGGGWRIGGGVRELVRLDRCAFGDAESS